MAGQRLKNEGIFIFLTYDWSIKRKQAFSLVNWDSWSITGIQPTLQTYLFLTNRVQTVYVRIENEGLMDLIPYQLPNLPRDIIIGIGVMEWKPRYEANIQSKRVLSHSPFYMWKHPRLELQESVTDHRAIVPSVINVKCCRIK